MNKLSFNAGALELWTSRESTNLNTGTHLDVSYKRKWTISVVITSFVEEEYLLLLANNGVVDVTIPDGTVLTGALLLVANLSGPRYPYTTNIDIVEM